MRQTSYKFAPLGARRSVVQRLRDELEELIRVDGMKPGEQIPSEALLSARFAVSRGTVRESLKLLEQDGVVDVQHGLGRFVSASAGLLVNRPVTHFESVTEMLQSLGYYTKNQVLSMLRTQPSEEERIALNLQSGVDVVRLRRLRLHKGAALILSINSFSAKLLNGDQLESIDFSGSLLAWLESRGHRLVSSAAQIRAVQLPPDVADLPEVDGNQPWLLITERCVDTGGAPVLFSHDFHRGDVFTFHVLRRREPNQ